MSYPLRTPVFELRILPMFRATDRDHMRRMFGDEFDLWNYDAIKKSIGRILGSLERSMPPAENGGPWPAEWILLLHRWKLTGFKRLQLGSAKYEVLLNEKSVELLASGRLPTLGFRG